MKISPNKETILQPFNVRLYRLFFCAFFVLVFVTDICLQTSVLDVISMHYSQ